MRIARLGRQFELGELVGLGIELADIALEVCCEPNVAVLVFHETVWPRARRHGTKFLDLTSLGIHAAENVRILPGVPEVTVVRRQRIMRPRAHGGHRPFLEAHLDRPRNDDSLGHISFRKALCQVIRHHGDLILRNLGAGRHHTLHEELPVSGSVPRVRYHRDRVASGAGGLNDTFSVTFGQRTGWLPALTLSRNDRAENHRHQKPE